TVTLSAISPDKRRMEAEFWSTFEAACPRLLGALCDAASVALRCKHEVCLSNLARIGEVAIWVTAASKALRRYEWRFFVASAFCPARRQITVKHKAERTPVKTVEKTPVKTTERTPGKTVERTPVNT